MRLKDELDPDIQVSRDVIDQQVNHLTRLIDDLLDVARITRDKIELRRGKLRLVDVLNGALASSRTVIEAHGHYPTVALPAESVWIDGDAVRLTQIFVNLLSNAAKYTPKGGNIWLSAYAENDKAIVSVKDDGIGIASNQLPHVFEMFYQADDSLERSQAGLGIGLTLTRRLVELHGGTIEARSDGPGKGSEFLVTLPAFIEQELAQPAEPPGGTHNENKANWRILVVDDGRNTREMYSVLLRKQGHEVDTAPDGKTGIEKIESFRPDAILLDVGMPGLNGFDTCERIRAQPSGKNVALIAVTGWAQEEVQQRAQAAGFDEVLVKPVGPQEILQSVGNILERKQAQ
jgi:CheY-like chemotaxis protein